MLNLIIMRIQSLNKKLYSRKTRKMRVSYQLNLLKSVRRSIALIHQKKIYHNQEEATHLKHNKIISKKLF